MYSNEDLEKFYFWYQTEDVFHGISLQSFYSKDNVLYNSRSFEQLFGFGKNYLLYRVSPEGAEGTDSDGGPEGTTPSI